MPLSDTPIRPRPKLALWLWRRDLDPRACCEAFGVSHETVRKWCLPFDDPARSVPQGEALERIFRETGGEIAPADFYPPHIYEPTEDASARVIRMGRSS